MRRTADFDHWAAFGDSFERLLGLVARAGAGEFGTPPASITMLSGDVHHAYLAELAFPRSDEVRSTVWQAVCSPYRNALDDRERRMMRLGRLAAAGRGLPRARAARRRQARAGPLAVRRGPVLRQPGGDPEARRPIRRAAAGAHGRRPGVRPPRASHVVRARDRLRPYPVSTGWPALRQVPTPPLPTWITPSYPSRWRSDAASPERLPPLQTAAIGADPGQLAEPVG